MPRRSFPRFPLLLALSIIAGASTACSKGEASREQVLSRADDYLAAGQYAKAEADYRNVLRRAPNDPAATGRLGILYYEQGELLQALPLLRQAAQLLPDDANVQLKLGLAYLSFHDQQHAREAALRVLALQQGNEEALLLLADTATEAKDIEEAQKTIADLRAKDTDRPGYHLALGELALRQNNQTAAESELKAADVLAPNSSAVHYSWANFYLLSHDPQKADLAFKAAADSSPLRSFRRIRYVDFKLQTGAAAEAKKLLEDITTKAPDYLPARVRLMKIVCAEHQEAECADRVKAILLQDPANYEGLLVGGSLAIAKGDVPRALRDYDYLSKLYPRSAQVQYQIAAANLLNTQDVNAVDNAINSLNLAVGLDPNFEQAKLLLADLRIAKGQYTAAIDALTELIKQRPQLAQAHLLLARAYLAQRNTDQALAVYRHMAELFPKDPAPPFFSGLILARLKQPDAREQLEKSLQIAPNYLPAVEALVDLDLADKQYANALDRIVKQIDHDPKLAKAWAIRAKIYLAQRDFTHAEADLLNAIELDPKLEPAYVWLAQVYAGSGRQEQAIEKLNAFVAKNDKDVTTLMQLAVINQQMKHFDAARDAYEKLLAVDPKFLPALNNLAVVDSENLGRLDAAYDLAKKAREASPQEPHTADTLGWILIKKGEYQNALQLLQESAGKLSDSPDVEYHLGVAYYMLGQDGPARVALQRAADAKIDVSKDAQDRLAILALDGDTANSDARTALHNYLHERPNDPMALIKLAALQERDGAVGDAEKTYQKIVDADPQFAPALRKLALRYANGTVDDKKASDLVRKAREAYPDDPELAKAAGILDYRLGNYAQAAERLRQAAAKHEDDPELVYYSGMVHYRLNQYPEANDELQHALGMNFASQLADEARRALADPKLTTALGVLSYQRGDYAAAAERLQQVAKTGKDDPELLYYLGMAHFQLKEYKQTNDELKQALDMNLSPDLAEKARHALADCCKPSQ